LIARPKLNTQQVRDAGQYFVAAEISRRGINEAAPAAGAGGADGPFHGHDVR